MSSLFGKVISSRAQGPVFDPWYHMHQGWLDMSNLSALTDGSGRIRCSRKAILSNVACSGSAWDKKGREGRKEDKTMCFTVYKFYIEKEKYK